jgi:hypothetical protein
MEFPHHLKKQKIALLVPPMFVYLGKHYYPQIHIMNCVLLYLNFDFDVIISH